MTISTVQGPIDAIAVRVGLGIREFTTFDQPLHATYRAADGSAERVSMLGSDVSRTAYPVNVVLIERPDGSLWITPEGRLS